MTKHRMVIWFVAIALLAVAATAAAIRSHAPSTDSIVVTASHLKVDVNKFPAVVTAAPSDDAAAVGIEESGDHALANVLGATRSGSSLSSGVLPPQQRISASLVRQKDRDGH